MQICIGPCCVPLHLVLAFVVGCLHNYGYLLWFKKEWVTFRYWRQRLWGAPAKGAAVVAAAPAAGEGSEAGGCCAGGACSVHGAKDKGQ